MRYETLFSTAEEKNHWLDLEVTLGTNDALINQDLVKLQSFLKDYDELELASLNSTIGVQLNPNQQLSLENNPILLKLLLIKKFIDQHGLSVIRESKADLTLSEKRIFLDLVNNLFTRGEYPDDIYVYSSYRQRGTPNTWFKVLGNETSDQIEQKIIHKTESLRRYINHNLIVSRKLRFSIRINDFFFIFFSKPIAPKVIKGEDKNLEAQRATYTIIVFDRNEKKIGVISGSKKEVQLIQRYIRYKIFPESIATPRSDHDGNKNDLLKKILASNPETGTLLSSVSFKNVSLPNQPSMRLKVDGSESLDSALSSIESIWTSLGIDSLKSVDYRHGGKSGTIYLYGDYWKRMFINVAAKRHSVQFENIILSDLNSRLGVNVKESRFIVEPLTDEFILEKMLSDKLIPTFPPIPEQVEKLFVKLVKDKIIKKPTKLAKRKCQHCFSTSWEEWECPSCGRSVMTIVGESVSISPNELIIIKKIADSFIDNIFDSQVTLIPYKQRRNYKKSVIRIYNPTKNVSVFVALITTKKDLPFVEDLINEGFGVVAIVDPDMLGKVDHLQMMGCDILKLHSVLDKLVNGSVSSLVTLPLESQEQRVIERIFSNLRTSITRLNNKPQNYDEDLFEVDTTNIFQAIVSDVVRLGTEYKGQKVPDGYCCYGYRTSIHQKRKRLLGWDAKYSFSSHYSLNSKDLKKQKGYIQWLTDKKNEPSKMGSLGIYTFISNFENPSGFETVLTNLATSSVFPKRCRLVLIEDKLLAEIGKWLLAHWQQIIENNSLVSEEIFKFFRKKRRARNYNILKQSEWPTLESKLNIIVASSQN